MDAVMNRALMGLSALLLTVTGVTVRAIPPPAAAVGPAASRQPRPDTRPSEAAQGMLKSWRLNLSSAFWRGRLAGPPSGP